MRSNFTTRCGLALLMLAVWSTTSPEQLNAQEYQFESPVRLQAAGKVIDTGKHIAHSGPAFADINNDGKMDLLVGNFKGTIEFFENIGSSEKPEYAAGKMLEAEGKQITVKNW